MRYLLAVVPVGLFAIALQALTSVLDRTLITECPEWAVWMLNIVPSLLAGFLGYFWLARALLARGDDPGLRAYLHRTYPLYVVLLVGSIYILSQRTNSDFWLFGQLVLWPTVAMLGGLLGDAAARLQRPRGAA